MFIPTMNANMLIATPLTSFCAAIGECQQKFLLGGAFYSPNERLLPPITQCDISGWNVNAMYTFGTRYIHAQ